MENFSENAIHVTGFGVFRGFTKANPSWETVSKLPDHIVHNGQTIAIVKHEVPVTYADVDKKVQEIWSTKPKVSFTVKFITNQFPVEVMFFDVTFLFTFVANLLQHLVFQLVVHCGVHGRADKICLERNAFNGSFREADHRGECLESCNVILPNSGSECERLCTSLNLNQIINEIDGGATIAKCSDHPGK